MTTIATWGNRSVAERKGFALIITLSLLVLVVLLGVGLLSLSSISLRSASAGQAQREAQANARLGMMIALGELQKHLGPDQRVSAPAGILDESPESLEVEGVEHPWWTAVWNTRWSGASGTAENVTPWVRNDQQGGLSDRRFPNGFDRKKEVVAYLVSGGEGGRIVQGEGNAIDAVSTNLPAEQAVLLVGPGTLGAGAAAPDSSKRVVAKRVPTINATRERGAYAFWVGDLGVKANVALVDRYDQDKPQRGGGGGGMGR
ncbi:MAG: hypothetical protein K9N23_09005, partial [Akkermansiaceae bacterium]|nr:hypothetical protein [Akkermansiaceae bacterium]